jgi:hypothetical protein
VYLVDEIFLLAVVELSESGNLRLMPAPLPLPLPLPLPAPRPLPLPLTLFAVVMFPFKVE